MTVKDQPLTDKTAELERQLAEKTAELDQKNRELQIEASLEKVRAIALSMKQPSDMLEICKTISAQLESLGVKEIRNVQTAIFHEEKGFYFNYEYYAKHDKKVFTETEYKNHPLHLEFAQQMLKGTGQVFIRTIKKKELPDWIKYQKTTNVFIDQFLETASSLTYYWHSLGPVALGMSTYVELSETEIELFKRFKNVFELSYRRYLDIEQAEAQAHEAKIEASLERVRAVALGMRTADDLLNICETLFHELHSLGFDEMRNAMINIHNDEKETFVNYDYSDDAGKTVNHLTYNIHPVITNQIKKIRSANDAFSETVFEGKELEDWKQFRKDVGEPDDRRVEKISSLHYYLYSIGTGSIGISSFSSLPEEKRELLKRFRNVFDFAYKRYTDIALAESQAREAQIELALERVRARTMAMQKSEELSETAQVLFNQFNDLGAAPIQITIGIFDEEEGAIEFHSTDPLGTGSKVDYAVKGSLEEPMLLKKIYGDWKEGKKSTVLALSGKELSEWVKYRISLSGVPDDRDYSNARRVVYVGFFSKGMLSVSAMDDPSRESVQLLERFAGVFDLTYTRFLDLKQAEAQAREAKIQLALERVRSKAMSMQKSEDLGDAIAIVFEQLDKLDIETLRCGISIINKENRTTNVWSTAKTGASKIVQVSGDESMDIHPLLQGAFAAWLEQKDFSYLLEGEDLKKFYTALAATNIKLPDSPAEIQAEAQQQYLYVAHFTVGGLYAFKETEFSEEEKSIIRRFGDVFNLTYTRFNDLKQAEAQAREAQIETALERVRSRTMGMQKSEELKEVIQVVYQQFVHLNIKIEHTGFVMDYKARDDYAIWIADPLGVPSQVIIPYFDSVYYNRFNEAKEKGEDFFATNLTFEEKNKFYKKLFEYVPGLPEESKKFYFNCPGLAASTVLLENVCLYIENFSGTPYSDEENATLMRFGKVFQQTYTRFLDLQKAEAQAREAHIEAGLERVRSRAMAMHKTDELLDAAELVYKELSALGITSMNVSYAFVDEEEKYGSYYSLNPVDGKIPPFPFVFPHTETEVMRSLLSSWKKQEPFNVIELDEEATRKHQTYIGEHILNLIIKNNINIPFSVESFLAVSPQTAVIYSFNFPQGYLFVIGEERLTTEQEQMVLRFTKVFELAYRRFLDLKKAEAQAREAQIEASLERVRSRAMAMHESSHLTEAAGALFTELNKLGINPIRSGFVLLSKDSRRAKLYPATSLDKENTVSYTGEFEFIGHPVYEMQYESWQKQENYFPILEGEVLRSYYGILSAALNVPYESFPTDKKQFGSFLPFTEGFLFTWSNEPYAEEQINILNRFKSILDLTIRRYLDLQKAEAQTREAQIEAGLERVRSRTLAMHSSDELAETAAVLFKQLILLGIEPNRLYIGIIEDETGQAEFWITDEDGSKVSSGFHADLNENITFKKMFAGWKEKVKSITIDMEGEELQEYFRHLTSLNVPFKGGLSQTRRVQNIAYFSQGFIGIASPDSQPEETDRLLERFASVFNLTYTRFTDLQTAEAQAHKAQIEAAMERVRSRALAMQEPEELMEVALLLRHQMGILGLEEIETGTIFIFDEATETTQFGFTAKDFSQPEKKPVNDTITVDLNQTWAGKEFLKFFRSEENQLTLTMEGAQRKEWIQYIYSLSTKANNYFGENIRDRSYHLLKFSNGAVAAVTDGPLLSEESCDLLSRASSVFSLAYSRFKDLTKARIDLINLKEEKKRSDSLLLNILPQEIADELKQFGKSYARKHDEVTILFADIKGFSSIAETLSAQELVTQLDECFRAFDHIVDKHGLEKIKTVGDAYVCACGLPKPVVDNAAKAVRAAIDMMNFIKGFSITRTIQDLPAFEFRIGIHTGPVVTGVVGLKKFTYDIWGDAVNLAARMEQHGEAGKINISGSTYALIKDKFVCTPRGKIPAKNKGEVEMYFVEHQL